MKILGINQFWFKLPDNFEGSFGDALKEIIKYWEEKGSLTIEEMAKFEKMNNWDEWIQSGKKVMGDVGLLEWKDGIWLDINGNPEGVKPLSE